MRASKPVLIAITIGESDVASVRVRIDPVLRIASSDGWRIISVPASRRTWPIKLMLALLLRPRLLLVQKVAPPVWATRVLRAFATRLVFELDDAIYLGYPGMEHEGAKIAARVAGLVSRADLVTTTSHAISSDLSFKGCQFFVMPGPVPDMTSIPDARDVKRDGALWLGSPSTYADASQALSNAASFPGIPAITMLGAPADRLRNGVTEQTWSETRQRLSLQSARIGLMPLSRSAWNDRKAAYKVFEYLAHGVVPVASDVPALRTALGAETETLCVTVSDEDSSAWPEAMLRAMNIEIDNDWFAARGRVFERCHAGHLAAAILAVGQIGAEG